MDYSEAVAAFFSPRAEGTTLPEAVGKASPARRLRDACEPIAMHAVWSPGTNERLAKEGFNFLTAYVGGRAASLGQPVGPVVASAFAWFEPGLVAALYDAAADLLPHAELLAVRDEVTTASLRSALDGDDPTEVADLLATAVEGADGTGRPLFSGLRGRSRPVDPVHRLWWACELIREHRGDSHIAAAAVSGVGPVEMNILTELWLGMPLLSYTASRGWAPEVMAEAVTGLERRGWLDGGALTAAGRGARQGIEELTDAQEQRIVVALGDHIDELCRQLQVWGDRCVAAGAFPADILKRAAG